MLAEAKNLADAGEEPKPAGPASGILRPRCARLSMTGRPRRYSAISMTIGMWPSPCAAIEW